MADTFHLSFSIGPVQGFVAQARRTRDLWAGSWLLSYLSECALVAAENAHGNAVIPHRDQPRVITLKTTAVGGIPNRFELRFNGDDPQARNAADAAVEAFREAWKRIAKSVWDQYVGPVASFGCQSQTIWRRQVDLFWELSWMVGRPDSSTKTIAHLAASRKHFRNVNASDEPGTKCLLMPTLQEISGHFGLGSRDKQKEFWTQLRTHLNTKLGTVELKETEQLSAIALIKRLFPHVIGEAVGPDIASVLRQVTWPSTAFMAALPWLKQLDGEARKTAEAYQRQAIASGYESGERDAARDASIDWAQADAPIWFASAVRNDEPGREKLGPKPTDVTKQRDAEISKLVDALKRLYRAAAGDPDGNKESRPVPYYALLLMDGDSMGMLLEQLGDPSLLSERLNRFCGGVDPVVTQGSGRTVYAGGDDVLALLPAESAVRAADQLCNAYREAFQDTPAASSATISAAIVYAHWRYPLRQVLRTAHHLLDDVAKDRTGRDSIALGVVLASGLTAEWSVPWAVFRGEAQTPDHDPCVALTEILQHFSCHDGDDQMDDEERKYPRFNTSYLYRLRECFGRLFHQPIEQPGVVGHLPAEGELTDDLLRDLAHAEYRRRMTKKLQIAIPREQTERTIDQLMSLSRRWRRVKTEEGGDGNAAAFHIECNRLNFSFDGWRVARFLKQIEEGKVEDHD